MKELSISREMLERSQPIKGNPYRIVKMFEKAKRGETVTFVALGGSITQRYNASSPERCYAALLAKWLETAFPKAKINYINAGIGATGSLIGVHRLNRDVLDYNPDFVTVEFAVNEGNGDFTEKIYDNLIAKILKSPSEPAVLSISMVNSLGGSAQETHEKVCRHYEVPLISYKNAVWPEIEAGRLTWQDLSDDIIHPTDNAHALIAELVINYLAGMFKFNLSDIIRPEYKPPLIDSDYQNAEIYYVGDTVPKSMGCFLIERVDLNKIPFGWVAHENGNPLVLEFNNCKRVYLLFERTNKGDGGKARVTAGNRETVLDADFKEGWGVYSNNALVFESDKPSAVHIEIVPSLEEGKHFAVAGVMTS